MITTRSRVGTAVMNGEQCVHSEKITQLEDLTHFPPLTYHMTYSVKCFSFAKRVQNDLFDFWSSSAGLLYVACLGFCLNLWFGAQSWHLDPEQRLVVLSASWLMRFLCLLVVGRVWYTPQWGAADAEIKVPSGENTEFERSPFIAWSRSIYSHTCYAYCQGFLPRLLLPFQSIHLHFFQNLFRFFPVLALPNTGSCVGPQNKIGQPAWCRFPCWVPAEYK